MKKFGIIAGFLALVLTAPSSANAEYLNNFVDDDSDLYEEEEDDNSAANGVLLSVEEKCCSNPQKGLKCLSRALVQLKNAPLLFSNEDRSTIRDVIVEWRNNLKSEGSCQLEYVDEDEGEYSEFE